MQSKTRLILSTGAFAVFLLVLALVLVGLLLYTYNALIVSDQLIVPVIGTVLLCSLLFFVLIYSMYGKLRDYLMQTETLKQQHDLFVEFTNEGIVSLNIKSDVIFCNNSLVKMLGYSEREMKSGNFIYKVFDHQNRNMADDITAALVEGRKFYSSNTTCLCKDGSSFFAEVWLYPLIENEDIVGGMMSVNDINARVSAFNALQRSEVILSEAQRISQLGSWEWYVGNRQMYWSAQIYKNLNLKPGECEPSFDLFMQSVHSEDRSIVQTNMEEMRKKPGNYDMEYRLKLSDDTRKIIRERVVAYHENNVLVRLMGTSQDITEMVKVKKELEQHQNRLEEKVKERTISLNKEIDARTLVEQELKEKSNELELIFNALPDLYFHVNSELKILSYQASKKEDLYVAPDQFIDKSFYDVLPSKVAMQYEEAVKQALVSESVITLQYELEIDSQVEIFEGRVLKIEHSECIIIVRNITAIMKAQQRVDILSQAVELSPVSVALMDPNGVIEYVNKKFCEVTQYSPIEVIGKHTRILKSGRHKKEFYKTLWDTIQRGEEWRAEICNKRKDGTYFWEMASIASIVDDHGEIKHYIAVKEDITEQQEVMKELNEAKKRAVDSNKAKSVFLASMSHELRTPLNSILGFGQLLNQRLGKNKHSKESEYILKILKSSNHLLSLITDILDLAKVESQAFALELSTVDVYEVLNESLDVIEHMASDKSISIIFNDQKGKKNSGAFLKGDYIRLKQVFINILSNAIKYNIVNGEIEVSLKMKEDTIELDIQDTGYGIAPEKVSGLFEPFNRLGVENTNIEGSGIGLTLSKKLMLAMGGDVWLKETSGKGSLFTVSMPYDKKVGEELMVSESLGEPTDLKNIKEKIRVLYVEDNIGNRELVRELLGGKKNIELIEAVNGEQGVELFKQTVPQVVLLDISLPDMDGYSVIKKIRELNDSQYVIALTANALPSEKRKAKRAGFSDYITKPIDIGEFYKVLDRFL